MHRVFIDPSQVDEAGHRVYIRGGEVNHIKNVLRMKEGEELDACESESRRLYRCLVEDIQPDEVVCLLCFIKEADSELPVKIYLFQALPKKDKLELIIQKAVELGVSQIIPVSCKRSVVKLEDGRSKKKLARWQAIAEGAAAQSRRAFVPEVGPVMSFKEALPLACNVARHCFIPYELADSGTMDRTRELFENIRPGEDVAVFIGPEGGFDEEEISQALASGLEPITLGRRILRTETAAISVLSWLDFLLG